MALVDQGYWRVNFTFQDNNGKTATMSLYAAGLLAFPLGVENMLTAIRQRITVLSDAALVGANVSRVYAENAPVDPIPASSEVERKLRIPLTTDIRSHSTYVEVPSPTFLIEQDGTDVPVTDAGALTELIDLLVNGGVGFENGGVTNANVQITGAGTPFVLHRNRPKKD